MLNLAEYRRPTDEPRRLPALGRSGRPRRRSQQGRLVPAHRALSRTRSRQRDAGRTRRRRPRASTMRCAASAPAGRFSSRRERSPAQHYPHEPLSRSGLGAGRRSSAERQFEEDGRAFREPLFSDAPLAAAGGGRGARRELALRRPRAKTASIRAELLRGFVDRTDRVLQLVEGFMPEAEWLDDGETLTYLHSDDLDHADSASASPKRRCISTRCSPTSR